MAKDVEDFAYTLFTDVFNTTGTASLAIENILQAQTHDPGPKAQTIEKKGNWTKEKIIEKASLIESDKGPEGDFDD